MTDTWKNDDKQPCSCVSHLRKRINELEYEVERLHSMSTIEMMWENPSVHDHVVHWEGRCLHAESEVQRLKAHTWEQERAAVVAWLEHDIPAGADVFDLFGRIKRGEHWPEGETP